MQFKNSCVTTPASQTQLEPQVAVQGPLPDLQAGEVGVANTSQTVPVPAVGKQTDLTPITNPWTSQSHSQTPFQL